MCRNEFDANRYLSVRQAPAAPLAPRKRAPRKLTPAGIFWLHYLAIYLIAAVCAYFAW